MVNRSPEQRGAVLHLTRSNPPRPPPHLGRTGRDLWQRIVASKQPDWFSPASLQLLTRYVRTAIYTEKLHDLLDAAPPGTPAAADLLRQVVACNGSLGGLSSKLRLTVQVEITPRSTGRMAERGSNLRSLPGMVGVL